MLRKIHYLTFLILIIAFHTGCAPKKVQITKGNLLTGPWNDKDSRLLSEEIITLMLQDNWLKNQMSNTPNLRPILIVGIVKNNCPEKININTISKDIERAMIKNGSVRLVQASDKRAALVVELNDPNSSKTIEDWGAELGADFIVQGEISSTSELKRKSVINNYKLNIELLQINNNQIVWTGHKNIVKEIIK